MRAILRVAAVVAGVAAALSPLPATAHFRLNIDLRIVHVEHAENGLRIYLRLPTPLIVAGASGGAQAPYTLSRNENGQPMHYIDVERLRSDPVGLGRLVAAGHSLVVDGRALQAEIEAVRVHPAAEQPRFSTLAEARAAMKGPPYPVDAPPAYVGDTVTDVALFYPSARAIARYSFSSRLAPGLPGEDEIANLLLDHGGEGTRTYRARGTLVEPIRVDASWLSAAESFVLSGIRHIAEGIDHVLFVLCLTIGAMGLANLMWRVTGFTLGHTITLVAGFFGLAPEGAWFIPMVETAIALSIIYAGVVALLQRPAAATFVVTTLIGLLHGFGFSFVLHKVLNLDSPDLWVSLISFNVGVEIGQAGIILMVWPLLSLVKRNSARMARYGRVAVAIPCIGVAGIWTGQRFAGLLKIILG